MKTTLPLLMLCNMLIATSIKADTDIKPKPHWFDVFKQQASNSTLYDFLYALPKGGDLHHHLGGSGFSPWWFELAINEDINGGYRYYTKVYIKQCNGYGTNEFGQNPQLLLFRTIQHSRYNTLSQCEQSEYRPLSSLSPEQKSAWLNSIRLDKSYEGRAEFFEKHWSRLGDLTLNPTIMAEILIKNMQAFAKEGLRYVEAQTNAKGKLKPDGSQYSPEDVVNIFRHRLAKNDAIATGVTARLQYSLLRFLPHAEQELEWMYRFVDKNRDIYVGINMVGREDNDKGYPLRFLSTLRKLRQRIPQIPLSIHAGEVDEPNFHVRDTLLLGANRIGHGVNLIDDPDTMLLMRNDRYLVEINLVSNLLLEYVDQYAQHPFPEYLRTGIPVALSTDDRGMWDSNMTDEYFVAVTEFNLSWPELIGLAENSLKHAFVDEQTKNALLADYQARIKAFEQAFLNKGSVSYSHKPSSYGLFICHQYSLCQITDQ
jgi:adenosine deaminase CECR1